MTSRGQLTAILALFAVAIPSATAFAQDRSIRSPISVIVSAQGTGDPYPANHSLICADGRFCTSIFDVSRRRPTLDPAYPAPRPLRIEIGVMVAGDGTVMIVPAMTGAGGLYLNCLASQRLALKPGNEATRLRFLLHESDRACEGAEPGKPAHLAGPGSAIASVDILVRTASQGI